MTHAMKYTQHENRYVIAFIFLAKKPVLFLYIIALLIALAKALSLTLDAF